MHEFNITIKLENKDYCNGCLFLDVVPDWCSRFKSEVKIEKQDKPFLQWKGHQARIRPEICKQNEVSNDK